MRWPRTSVVSAVRTVTWRLPPGPVGATDATPGVKLGRSGNFTQRPLSSSDLSAPNPIALLHSRGTGAPPLTALGIDRQRALKVRQGRNEQSHIRNVLLRPLCSRRSLLRPLYTVARLAPAQVDVQ